MRTKQQIIFKRKQLSDLLTKVENFSYSEKEQDRIIQDISVLNWVLNDDIEPNKLLTNH